jgi:hypothetical protein
VPGIPASQSDQLCVFRTCETCLGYFEATVHSPLHSKFGLGLPQIVPEPALRAFVFLLLRPFENLFPSSVVDVRWRHVADPLSFYEYGHSTWLLGSNPGAHFDG